MERPTSATDRIIVALDVSDYAVACQLIQLLAGHVGGFSIGMQLQTAIGAPAAIDLVHGCSSCAVLDSNLHFIPSVMAATTRTAVSTGASAITVSASAGTAAMKQVVEAKGRMSVLATTVPTSLIGAQSQVIYHRGLQDVLHDFAHDAAAAKVDGLICAPADAELIRAWERTRYLQIFAAGIRPEWASNDDQGRVGTPTQAISWGADFLVIGRPIIDPPNGMTPLQAVSLIKDEIARATEIRDGRIAGR